MSLRVSLLAMIVLGSACLTEDPTTAELPQEIGGDCQTWMCGSNSPEIANFGFWDLKLPKTFGTPGDPNRVGIQILAFYKTIGATTGAYLPRVIQGRLYAFPTTDVAPANTLLAGSSLVNGFFLLWTPSGPFKLWVQEVGRVTSWAQPAGTPPNAPTVFLESYRLNWSNLQGEIRTNVCDHPGGRDDLGRMNGPLSFHTLLFEGDRIDAPAKNVTGVEPLWFNLGCAGSTLAKMALTGHTQASQNAGTFTTTLDQRQTMLKMLTADYCNLGKPFTVAGQPLNWADDGDTMNMIALLASPPRPVIREARWNAQGATCLDRPRVDAHWTLSGEQEFLSRGKSVYEQVQAACGSRMPPPCAPGLGNNGFHLITATEPHAPPP